MTDILTHAEAGVMTVTFNRLERKNSITADMYGALAEQAGLSAAKPGDTVQVGRGTYTGEFRTVRQREAA